MYAGRPSVPLASAFARIKRKHEEEDEGNEEEGEYVPLLPPMRVTDANVPEFPSNTDIRENAILLYGTPISHLPTNNIFAYATQFDTKPTALEWIDDTTCILVFPTRASARAAFGALTKTSASQELEDGFVVAKSVPVHLWPPEDRINESLGKGEGLKGAMKMRWATPGDVKQRGANKNSEFYKRYGRTAGRTDEGEVPEVKRRRRDVHEAEKKAELDQELEEFLTEERGAPSRTRSDHINSDGRTLFDRLRPGFHSRLGDLGSRRERPRRSGRESEGATEEEVEAKRTLQSRLGGERRGRNVRPKVTAEDLDAELDAFLKEGNNQG